jgi:hypothetical protein
MFAQACYSTKTKAAETRVLSCSDGDKICLPIDDGSGAPRWGEEITAGLQTSCTRNRVGAPYRCSSSFSVHMRTLQGEYKPDLPIEVSIPYRTWNLHSP